ncbi:hypothetical protein V1514DRAFT_343491 [Lipomyces japonicus]|uniref:uncharacterized protein n=1 Tax=Lipomyces japonicus TaxID=56871 RepID=UPI0034CD9FC0
MTTSSSSESQSPEAQQFATELTRIFGLDNTANTAINSTYGPAGSIIANNSVAIEQQRRELAVIEQRIRATDERLHRLALQDKHRTITTAAAADSTNRPISVQSNVSAASSSSSSSPESSLRNYKVRLMPRSRQNTHDSSTSDTSTADHNSEQQPQSFTTGITAADRSLRKTSVNAFDAVKGSFNSISARRKKIDDNSNHNNDTNIKNNENDNDEYDNPSAAPASTSRKTSASAWLRKNTSRIVSSGNDKS